MMAGIFPYCHGDQIATWISTTKDRARAILFAVIILASIPCVAFAQDTRARFPEDIAKEFARLTTTLRDENVGGRLAGLRLARWEHSPITWTILGNKALTMRDPLKPSFMGKFLSAQMATKGRLKAAYIEPTGPLPAGAVLAADDLPINRLAQALISFEIHFDANGLPRLTTKYASSAFTVTTSADLTAPTPAIALARVGPTAARTGHGPHAPLQQHFPAVRRLRLVVWPKRDRQCADHDR